MISKTRTDARGIVSRQRVKGSPGQWCEDMRLVPITITVPKWLKRWLDRQPETRGLLLEKAAVEFWGASPPKLVRECLARRKQAEEEKISAKVATLQRAAEIDRFRAL